MYANICTHLFTLCKNLIDKIDLRVLLLHENTIIDHDGDEMEKLVMWEMLALQKHEEDLRFAEQQRIVRQASRDSSPSIWNRFLGWAIAGRQGDRKPARA